MNWQDITDNGRVYCMSHLRPFSQSFTIGGSVIDIRFTFGFHCFTDEKGNGKLISNQGEERNFSPDRWESSKEIRNWITKRLLTDKVIPFNNSQQKRRYFCLDLYDYAIFLQISKPVNTTNKLKIMVVSAYEVDPWGESTLPKGKRQNLDWVLKQRVQGLSV